jgi:hypothetical protein
MKGQTAIEYLMTYGWAILIILIVAGVLAYYGIFAPSGFLGCSVSGFSNIALLNPWSFSTTGTFQGTLENRVGQPITLTSVKIGSTTVADNTTFSTAEKKIVTVTGLGGAVPANSKVGDTFTDTITIGYTTDAYAHNFSSSGSVSCKYA